MAKETESVFIAISCNYYNIQKTDFTSTSDQIIHFESTDFYATLVFYDHYLITPEPK